MIPKLDEDTYAMSWVCSNCGKSGVDTLIKGNPAIGTHVCSNCGCPNKRYVKDFFGGKP